MANGVVAVAAVTIASGTTSTSSVVAMANAVASTGAGLPLTATATGSTITINQPIVTTSITVATNPPGLQILVDGATLTAPQTFQWTPGSQHTINTNSSQGSGSTRYLFSNWSDNGPQSHTITTPSSPTTYTASFTTQYLLSTSVNPASSGSVQANPSSANGFYNAGSTVQLTASPAAGYQFSSWTGSATGTSNPVSVNMSAPRSVTANFSTAPQGITITTNPPGLQILVDGSTVTAPQTFQWTPGSQHTINTNSPQGSGSTRYLFSSWSDNGTQSHTITTPSSPTTYTATFTTQYLLSTSVSPASSGSVQANPSSANGFYNAGSTVQLTASPATGYQFSSWTGSATGTSNPVSVNMSAPRSVTANFSTAPQGITITTNPPGLQILVDGSTVTAPQTFQWTPGSQHTINTNSPQGSGSTRYLFSSWSDSGPQSHTITTPSSSTTYTASFTTQYLLSTSVSPASSGSVQANPSSGNGFYNAGSTVQLTASPAAGYQFSSWTGSATGTSNPVSVNMSAPRSVTANFSSSPLGVTITTNPPGLQILVDGATLTAPQTFQWTPGSQHTINTSSPQGSGGTRYLFSNWSDTGTQSHTITTPSSPTTYTASFTTQYLLSTSVSPAGTGSIQANPSSADGFYNNGTIVQLTAVPVSGFQFSSWSGGISAGTALTTVNIGSPISAVANFNSASTCAFTLSRTTFSASSEGDFGRVGVTTGESCNWNATSNSPWLTIGSGAAGTGSGFVGFTVAANPASSPRSGSLTIGGQSFTVTQTNFACGSNINIANAVVGPLLASASSLTLNISAPSSCQWSTSVPPDWIAITSGSTGLGSGSVQLSIATNQTANPRVASVQIGGSAIPLIQLGTTTPQFYSDVPPSYLFVQNINLLVLNGILSGCTPTAFCPEVNATRADAAPLIIRSLFGDSFTYSPAPYFTDVPVSHSFFKYIQKMRELEITVGCTATEYCPNGLVTRGQMAAFLIRAKLGGAGISVAGGVTVGQSVYPSAPYFQDVPSSHVFFPFIQKIKQLGITFGCTSTQYCAENLTTRGQLAAFLTRGFLTP